MKTKKIIYLFDYLFSLLMVRFMCCNSPNLWVSPNWLFQHSGGRIVNRAVLGPVCLPVNFVIWDRKAACV